MIECPQNEKDLKHHCEHLNNLLGATKELWDICCIENPPYDSQLVPAGTGLVFELGTQIHAGVSTGNYVDENGCDHRITMFLVKVPCHSQQKMSRLLHETTEMPWGLIVDIKPNQILEAQKMFRAKKQQDQKTVVDEKDYSIVAFALEEGKSGYFLVHIQDDNHCVYMKMNENQDHFIVDYADENDIPCQSIACQGKLDPKGCLSLSMIARFRDCHFVRNESRGDVGVANSFIKDLLSHEQQKILLH